jgi:hypothetical protein
MLEVFERPRRVRKPRVWDEAKVEQWKRFIGPARVERMIHLDTLSGKARGTMALDHPARLAGDAFCELALEVHRSTGLNYGQLSAVLGRTESHVRLKLGRRGYIKNPPSQSAYKGVMSQEKRRERTHCNRGHEFTEANTHYYKQGRVCKICRADQDKGRAR